MALRYWKQIIALLGLLLGVAASASAAPRTVRVEEPEEGAIHWLLLPTLNLKVIKAFSERIAVSDRYSLSGAPAELVVVIICVDASKLHAIQGCSYQFEFRSKSAPEFSMPLGTPIPVVGSDATEIAGTIFEDFVAETSEAKLSVAELEAKFRVANFCSRPENKVPCSGKLQ
jgi:hypothetical protein